MDLDVARPDKISGADINAICQEVSNVNEMRLRLLMVILNNTGWYAGCP